VSGDVNPLQKYQDDQEAEAWSVLNELAPRLGCGLVPCQVEFASLFRPSLHENLAAGLVQFQRASDHYSFLTPAQLHGMACGLEGSERDIEVVAGVYIFLRLIERDALKVGQTNNLRLRIAKQHLLYCSQVSDSNVVVYCRGQNWPDYIYEHELAALLFPMRNSCEADRCIIEFGLQQLLTPDMK
jgi:hypothetical protein